MLEKANLSELFAAQAKLDETIHQNHNVNYTVTHDRRILALLVEIGEFANTTRCFKYWSNKGMEEKETVLDEYADGMHFFLSLGIDIESHKTVYEIEKPDCDLTSQIHLVYSAIEDFKRDCNELTYEDAFSAFLNIIPLLGYSFEEVKEAYFKKLGVNYVRQDTNY
ncbi:MAG: dUTP diphosphatase [Bacilli bacterium]|nr:dUTP diphosphatase [Bacilli bacterium]